MSYAFDLVRLPQDSDPEDAYKKLSQENERKLLENDNRAIDPILQAKKQQLAAALQARHPSLQLFQPDYDEIAKAKGIDGAEARRQFRNVELNEKQYRIQIILFDDAAGASFSFSGPPAECTEALRLLWDCLEILASQGGFSTYDSQVGKVLDVSRDFDLVLKNACGIKRGRGES